MEKEIKRKPKEQKLKSLHTIKKEREATETQLSNKPVSVDLKTMRPIMTSNQVTMDIKQFYQLIDYVQ